MTGNIYQWETAEEINKKLADRVRNIRKSRKISPAYDLTYSNTYYGEHTTTVDGNGKRMFIKCWGVFVSFV